MSLVAHVYLLRQWVEMSYKESKDKADRACRDAARKLEKKLQLQQQQQCPPPILSKQQHQNNGTTEETLGTEEPTEITLDNLFEPDPIMEQQFTAGAYRNPCLDHSCGSLMSKRGSITISSSGGSACGSHGVYASLDAAVMEMSNLSLDFKEEAPDDEKHAEDDDDDTSTYPDELMASYRSGGNAGARLADSCMSLDLLSLETPKGTEQTAPVREDSENTLKAGTRRRDARPPDDVLSESFNKSMDFR